MCMFCMNICYAYGAASDSDDERASSLPLPSAVCVREIVIQPPEEKSRAKISRNPYKTRGVNPDRNFCACACV